MGKFPKYLFLDLYGTLTNGDGDAIRNICKIIENDIEQKLTDLQIEKLWGENIWALLKESFGANFKSLKRLEKDALGIVLSEYNHLNIDYYVEKLEEYWSNPAFIPNVSTILNSINLPVCIVSNSDRQNATKALDKIKYAPDFIITSEDAKSYKPNIEIFEFAQIRTGWNKNLIWLIGDSLNGDIAPAKQLGLKTILVNNGTKLYDPGQSRPDFEISSFSYILDIILK